MTTRIGRTLVVVLAVALLVGAVAGGTAWYRSAHRQVLVVVDPACPALLTGTSNAAEDFADVVTWTGRTYVRVDDGPDWAQGASVGAVSCSIEEMDNPQGWRVAPGTWPDGTATRLPRGTVLHSVGRRALASEEKSGALTLYCAADPSTLDPSC